MGKNEKIFTTAVGFFCVYGLFSLVEDIIEIIMKL